MADQHSGEPGGDAESDPSKDSGSGAAGAPPEKPQYNVYRSGSGRRFGRGSKNEPRLGGPVPTESGKGKRDQAESTGDSGSDAEKPEYTVYKSGRGLKKPDVGAALEGLRARGSEAAASRTKRRAESPAPARARPSSTPGWRRVLRWGLIAAGAWLLLSVILFGVSAQIQKGKLDGDAKDELATSITPMLFSGETILVMGTDARPSGTDEAGAESSAKCVEEGSEGSAPSPGCSGFRADTLMVVRAGGGSFEKLSIPRDTYAEIPGNSPQKINAAYAFGGAALQIETVENFLGIDIDHTVIIDFEGFADFIDSIGGVEVALREPVFAKISGGSSNGGITLKLDKGRHTLDGQRALALARVRSNACPPNRKNCNNSGDDTDRARRQQLILAGIKDRMTSITRAPRNFLHGPWIAWNAPKAMVTDMGGFQMPQLAMSAAIGGDSGTRILQPKAAGPGGSLLASQKECGRAVRQLLGGKPERKPACSPGGPVAAVPPPAEPLVSPGG